MRRLRRWWWGLLLAPVLLVSGFVIWAQSTPTPMTEADAAVQASTEMDGVLATTGDWLTFGPVSHEPSTGLILYPGGRVEPEAHAPAAREVAAQGYLVVVVPMPLNLAFFAPGRAAAVIDSFPQVTQWVVGGHSLGGAMAARFAHRHPGTVEGLLLWASYPAQSDDLSDQDLSVTAVYATNDGLSTPEEIAASRHLLPSGTQWIEIEGGNHAQFGWYGSQAGDLPATISREAQ
ncbi:MAG: alpha/beta hydrolase [Chloroflexota bacterium]|nr:alpha/beta hydrolase [Chloroflexota bacterium]